MNDPTLIGPCADYEHDLVDLHDGTLAPDRVHVVRRHLEACPRCQSWQAEFAILETRLAAELPRPELSATFDAKLQQRLAALARPSVRSDLRAALEREHDSLIDTLQRGARRRAVLGALGSAAATLCALAAVRGLLAQGVGLLPSVAEGPERWLMLGIVGVAMAVAALGWSAGRNGVPTLGLLR
jgi:anti-sigma factor RsiW